MDCPCTLNSDRLAALSDKEGCLLSLGLREIEEREGTEPEGTKGTEVRKDVGRVEP